MEADVEEEEEEGVKVRPFSKAKHLRGSGRAASCSDLFFEMDPTQGARYKVSIVCTAARLTQGTVKISHSLPLVTPQVERKRYGIKKP